MTIAETPTLPADAWEITLVADFLRRRGYTAALDALTIEAPEFFPSDDATTTIYDAIVGKVVPQVAQCGNGSGGKSGEDSAWLTAIVLEWRRAIKSAAG